jgi:hypothetical protein
MLLGNDDKSWESHCSESGSSNSCKNLERLLSSPHILRDAVDHFDSSPGFGSDSFVFLAIFVGFRCVSVIQPRTHLVSDACTSKSM